MSRDLSLLGLIILILCKLSHSIYDSNAQFANKRVLVEPDQYLLMWNYTETDITFKIVVKHLGWIGFGLSPNGEMDNSDMIVTYLNSNGSVHFTDRHTEELPITFVDKSQDWYLFFFEQKNGFTTVIFTRKLVICKSNPDDLDIDILTGTQHLIYAWGSNFINGDISYHGAVNRSTTVLSILDTVNQNIVLNMDEIETVEFRVNASLTNGLETEYFCQMFRLPTDWTKTKRHLVKYETLIGSSQPNIVHHWLFYECSVKYESIYIKNDILPEPDECFNTSSWPYISQFCTKISLAWAIGSPLAQDLPLDIAYPLGGSPNEFKYFYLQMHYDNHDLVSNVKDNSGIRLYVTKNYRPIEFGVLTTGAVTNFAAIAIPPNSKSMSFDFYCSKDCTNYFYQKNSSNVTIFAVLPHSHLAGREMYTKVVRNGSEIADLVSQKNYDSNHQYINFLSKPVVLHMNDELKTTCVYNTQSRTKFTIGDISTMDEMCLSFIWYYPRNENIGQCLQYTSTSDWGYFLYYLNNTGQIFLPSYDSSVVKASILAASANSQSESVFQYFFDHANITQFCFLKDEVKFNEFPHFSVKKLEKTNICDITTTTTTTTTVTTTKTTSTTSSYLPISQVKNLAVKIWNAIASLFKKIF